MKKTIFLIPAIILIVPSFALAAWWNPFTWGIFNQTNNSIPVTQYTDNSPTNVTTVNQPRISPTTSNSVPISTSISPQLNQGKEIYIFVDNTTYNSLSAKISRLANDITSDTGAKVVIQHDVFSNPMTIRNLLKQSYSKNALLGSILIGNIPTFTSGTLYTDWFYGALNDSCTLQSDGSFNLSSCSDLNASSRREVFTGRITPPQIDGLDPIARIGQYLDKNHAYRIGQITFPKKMLLYPSVDILDRNNGTSLNKDPLSQNVAIALASQSRYSPQDVDVIYDTDYVQQKLHYLNDLKNNRYESAIINIHGASDAQMPSQKYDDSMILGSDIVSAKPNILYIEIAACNNGAFKSPNYLAGNFLFNGDTLLVTANTEAAGYGALLPDQSHVPTFFQSLSFLNSSAPLGQMLSHDQSLFITQTFGDPTLKINGNPAQSQLQISTKNLDFGMVGQDIQTKSVTIKNNGNQVASVLNLGNWGYTVDGKRLLYPNSGSVLPGRNFQGFTVNGIDRYSNIQIDPHKSFTFQVQFSPAMYDSDSSIVNGTYFDTLSFLTSDPIQPLIDLDLQAKEGVIATNPWKTYTNSPYAFNVSYPNTWQLAATEATQSVQHVVVNIESPAKHDLVGYENSAVYYLVQIILNKSNFSVNQNSFVYFPDRSIKSIPMSDTIRAADEYKLAQQIISSIQMSEPNLLTYSGSADTGLNFSLKYPASWVYYKFSCNIDGVAFWSKSSAPNFSQGGACSMNSFLNTAPITLTTVSQPTLNLIDKNFTDVYNQMKASLISH